MTEGGSGESVKKVITLHRTMRKNRVRPSVAAPRRVTPTLVTPLQLLKTADMEIRENHESPSACAVFYAPDLSNFP